LISSAACWDAALLITALIGGLWFLLAIDPAGYAVPAAAVGAITAVVGVAWQQSRARGTRRKAALDAYAKREIARTAATRQDARERRITV
jgi:hypothetical protein